MGNPNYSTSETIPFIDVSVGLSDEFRIKIANLENDLYAYTAQDFRMGDETTVDYMVRDRFLIWC